MAFSGATCYKHVEMAAQSLGLTVDSLQRDYGELAISPEDSGVGGPETTSLPVAKDGTFPVADALEILSDGRIVGAAFKFVKAKREQAAMREANLRAKERLRRHAEQVVFSRANATAVHGEEKVLVARSRGLSAAKETAAASMSLAQKLQQLEEARPHMTDSEFQVVRMMTLESFATKPKQAAPHDPATGGVASAAGQQWESQQHERSMPTLPDEFADVTVRLVTPSRKDGGGSPMGSPRLLAPLEPPVLRFRPGGVAPSPIRRVPESSTTFEDLFNQGSRPYRGMAHMSFTEALARTNNNRSSSGSGTAALSTAVRGRELVGAGAGGIDRGVGGGPGAAAKTKT
jgi:hypothetical protein